jgi:acyl-CoA thioesterase-1
LTFRRPPSTLRGEMKAPRLSTSQLVRILFYSATLSSVCHAEPRRATHVACVGDSITYGYLASHNNKSYPAVLQGLVGDSVEVRNFGRNSATMLKSGNFPYWDQTEFVAATEFVENAGPDAVVSVVILLGANDSKPVNWTPAGQPKKDAAFIADYEAMIDHFANLSTKPVVYIGLPVATGNDPCCQISGTVIRDEQVPLLQALAAKKQLPVIDLNTPTSNHPEYFSDGVHPTDAGYAVLAELVRAGLNREPTVSLTSPSDGATLAAPLKLSATASGDTVPVVEVEFFAGETSLGTVGNAPFELDWPAAPGHYVITAKATDSTLASATSEPIEVTVSDETPSSAGGTGGSGGSTSGGGASGAGAAPGNSGGKGGQGDGGETPSGSAGTPSGGAHGGSASNAPSGAEDEPSNGGGCRFASNDHQRSPLLALGVMTLLAVRRRRRPNARSTFRV